MNIWAKKVIRCFLRASTRLMKLLTIGFNARNGYYRRAIRDALSHSNRRPFQCGGLKAYDQLIAVEAHLHSRQQKLGTDPYLAQLHCRVKAALRSSSPVSALSTTSPYLSEATRTLFGSSDITDLTR